jgi:PAS domain S-box-containing protein
MKLQLTIGHKWLIMLACAFFPPMLVTLIIIGLMGQAEVELWHESQSKQVVSVINHIGRTTFDATESLVRYGFSRQPSSKASYYSAYEELITHMQSLEQLAYDNPRQMANVRALERVANSGLGQMDQSLHAIEQPEKGLFIAQTAHLNRLISDLLSELSTQAKRIVEEEDKTQREAVLTSTSMRHLVINILYGFIAFEFCFALFLAVSFSKGIKQRLDVVVDNAERLSKKQQLNQPLKGPDEIAYLDRAFHKMAETLAELARRERAVVDNAVEVICSIAESGRFNDVNPAAKAVWGYTPDELTGKRFTDMILEEDKARVLSLFQEMLHGKTVKEFETRVNCKDGRVIDMLWLSTWSQEQQSVFCVAHDITARKELERLKQEFVAMVSHDLRTPLTSIQFAINIAIEELKETAPPGALDELKTAERIGESLINMINALLDLEKIEAGKLQLSMSEMKVTNLIKRSVDQVQSMANASHVEIETPVNDIVIEADVDRLLQVMVNLLSNAVKFSPEGGKIKISVDTKDDTVEFRVADEGKGIPPAYKDAIFDRFQQVKVTQFRFKGTGLGLAIAKAIVEAHGGKIGVDSDEGQGSTFWFRLPLKGTAGEAPEKTPQETAPGA